MNVLGSLDGDSGRHGTSVHGLQVLGNVITTDIRIGRHVLLNVGCTVSHDSVIEDYVTLAPGVNISGTVGVERGATWVWAAS